MQTAFYWSRKPLNWLFVAGLFIGVLGSLDSGAATISYTGELTGSHSTHDGEGYFRFRMVDPAGILLWKHADNPKASVTLKVENGRYFILLGGSHTNSIPPRFWINNRLIFLQISFSPGLGKPFDPVPTNQPILSLSPHSTSRIGHRQVVHQLGGLDPNNITPRVREMLNRTLFFDPDQSSAASYQLQPYTSLTKEENEELEKITWEAAGNAEK